MIGIVDIRRKGIKAIKEELSDKEIGILSYRGKKKYVIMDLERYEELREAELENLYKKAMEDYKNGKYETLKTPEDIKKHIESL